MKYKETTCFINLKQWTQEKGELQFEKNCKDIKLIFSSCSYNFCSCYPDILSNCMRGYTLLPFVTIQIVGRIVQMYTDLNEIKNSTHSNEKTLRLKQAKFKTYS